MIQLSNISPHHPLSRRGFTLIELCLGLVIVAMVMSALAAFALAVANCWRYSDSSQESVLAGNQAVARLQHYLLDAKRIGYCRTWPLGVVFWREDANADGQMQFSELGIIRWDEPTRTLEFRQAIVAPGDSDQIVTYAELTAPDILARVQDTSLSTPLLHDVDAANIAVEHPNDPVVAPTVQVSLTFSSTSPAHPGMTQVVAATLRGPAPAQ